MIVPGSQESKKAKRRKVTGFPGGICRLATILEQDKGLGTLGIFTDNCS